MAEWLHNQVDFLYLLIGMAFAMLAFRAISISRNRLRGMCTAFAVFAALQALAAWTLILALSLPHIHTMPLIALIARLASVLALFDAARRALIEFRKCRVRLAFGHLLAGARQFFPTTPRQKLSVLVLLPALALLLLRAGASINVK